MQKGKFIKNTDNKSELKTPANSRLWYFGRAGLTIALSVLVIFTVVKAGSLTPPNPPTSPEATSYTLDDIYTRLTTNAFATAGNHDISTSTSPTTATFYSLTDIYSAIPTVYAGDFLASSTYLGVTGNVEVVTGNTAVASSSAQGTSLVFTIPQGYYSGANSVTVSTTSPSFTEANIANGVYLFGVTGSLTAAAPLKTGQTICYAEPSSGFDDTADAIPCAGSGQDGESKRGVATSTSDNGNGTITDNSTGLMWQTCSFGLSGSTCGTGTASSTTWGGALKDCDAVLLCNNGTFSGSNGVTGDCSGAGGTLYSDWHLPNVRELLTLVDYGRAIPAIDPIKFPNTVPDGKYWSSTTFNYPGSEGYALAVDFLYGSTTNSEHKLYEDYVRCVRLLP